MEVQPCQSDRRGAGGSPGGRGADSTSGAGSEWPGHWDKGSREAPCRSSCTGAPGHRTGHRWLLTVDCGLEVTLEMSKEHGPGTWRPQHYRAEEEGRGRVGSETRLGKKNFRVRGGLFQKSEVNLAKRHGEARCKTSIGAQRPSCRGFTPAAGPKPAHK